jgi:hypothetical protein
VPGYAGDFLRRRHHRDDNLLNAPQRPQNGWNHRTYDATTKDEFFHGVALALDVFTVRTTTQADGTTRIAGPRYGVAAASSSRVESFRGLEEPWVRERERAT